MRRWVTSCFDEKGSSYPGTVLEGQVDVCQAGAKVERVASRLLFDARECDEMYRYTGIQVVDGTGTVANTGTRMHLFKQELQICFQLSVRYFYVHHFYSTNPTVLCKVFWRRGFTTTSSNCTTMLNHRI